MNLLLSSVLLGLFTVACGSAAPPAASPPVEAPAPSTTSAAGDVGKACSAAGGKCMPLVVTVACKSQPAADCGAQKFCCVM